MNWLGEFARRIGMLLHRDRVADELQEEIHLHLDLRRQEQVEAGVAATDAAAAARRRFGNPTLLREHSYTAWGWNWLETLTQDVIYGLRAMLRTPGITLVALLSLALGIGANTAIFSLMDAVMLRSLPVKEPGELVLLGKGEDDGIGTSIVDTELYSYPFYRQLQQKNAVFTDVAAVFSMIDDVHGFVLGSSAQGPPDPELMHVQLVSGTYFPLLGVQAAIGRTLIDADDTSEGDHPVAVVSHAFWTRTLASDPNVLDRKLKLGTTIFNIVGVAPPEFFGTKVGEAPDMWVPMSMTKFVPPGWDAYQHNFTQSLNLMGRLKPGITIERATSNVNLLLQQITRGFSDADLSKKNLDKLARAHVPLTPMATGLSSLRREFSKPLQILMAIVALVLLIACANIANLLLARSTTRAREFAVRQALGARRSRIIRQLLTESLILALIGGSLGIGFAAIANRLLLRLVSGGFETIPLNICLDHRMLGFACIVTVATAILFGTIPAFRATRLDLTNSLKDGRGSSSVGAKSLLAKALVISQVALSLVLMVGAGLFLRSLVKLSSMDPGFNRENVLRLQIDSTALGLKKGDPRLQSVFQQIESRVSALPGVQAASFSAFTFDEGSWNDAVLVPGMPHNEDIAVHQNVVGNDYFKVMQIPLLAGRTFGPQDTATSQHVAVISERIAKNLFPPGNSIGRHIHVGKNDPENDYEVIGIVRDAKFSSLQEKPKYINYLSYLQSPWSFGDFDVRYSGDFGAIAASVQSTIHQVDRNLPISHVTTLDEQVARSYTDQRLVAQLSTFFGLLAVFLSAIGIYGLMSYVVSRRTNEIGIRMALGAERVHVRWMVMREILVLVVIGIVIGVPTVLLTSRLVASMLFGLSARDPLSLLAAIAVLLAIAAFAGYLPARRASRVDPMVALRYE
jgi:predicted permease